MRNNTRYTQFRTTADVLVMKAIQPAGEAISGLQADVAGTLGVSTFNTGTGKYTSTVTNPAANPYKISYKDGDGNIITLAEMLKSDTKVEKSPYAAPQKQITTIGYAAAGTSLNYTTVVAGDEMIIRITDTTETGAGQPYNTMLPYVSVADATDTVFSLLSKVVGQISDDNNFHHDSFDNVAPYNAKIISSLAAGSALANNATVTKGSDLVASTGHALDLGDFVYIAGDLYQVTEVIDANNFRIDRKYAGVSGTILAANITDAGATAPTELGVQITTTLFGETFSVALDGVLENADNTLTQTYGLGSGEASEVALLERINGYSRGNGFYNDERTREYPEITLLADPTKFYTLYKFSNKDNVLARRDRFKTNLWVYVEQADASTASTLLDFLI